MKVFVFSSHGYDRPFLIRAAEGKHELLFTEKKLNKDTVALAKGCDAVSLFTADDASAEILTQLQEYGIRYVALRSAGYDHVDLTKAETLNIRVANSPEYSPYSIAEHAVAMLMAVNRKIVESRILMQLQDFRLDSLTGFDIHGKTVGVVGTGKIGMAFATIMHGFGAILLGYDPKPNPAASILNMTYVPLTELLRRIDIISLHCPLNTNTKYMLALPQFQLMKKGAIVINTGRGALIKTNDLIDALENNMLGAACLDVLESEKGLFFEDHRQSTLKDVQYARLRNLKNVLITAHQAFLTEEALKGIADLTIKNLDYWQQGDRAPYELTREVLINAK